MKVVLLLSGGLDSTVLLAHLVSEGKEVIPITFDYGQENRSRELVAAGMVADHYRLDTQVIELPDGIFGHSALLGHGPIPEGHAEEPDSTTVPGRNLVFCSIAAAIAMREGARAVTIGANLDDDAGYLDCRPEFVMALDSAVSLGTGKVSVVAPYLSYSKARIIGMGRTLDAPMHLSWSCYHGSDTPCGACGACLLREEVIPLPTTSMNAS